MIHKKRTLPSSTSNFPYTWVCTRDKTCQHLYNSRCLHNLVRFMIGGITAIIRAGPSSSPTASSASVEAAGSVVPWRGGVPSIGAHDSRHAAPVDAASSARLLPWLPGTMPCLPWTYSRATPGAQLRHHQVHAARRHSPCAVLPPRQSRRPRAARPRSPVASPLPCSASCGLGQARGHRPEIRASA